MKLTGLFAISGLGEELRGGFPFELTGNSLSNSPFKKGLGGEGGKLRKNQIKQSFSKLNFGFGMLLTFCSMSFRSIFGQVFDQIFDQGKKQKIQCTVLLGLKEKHLKTTKKHQKTSKTIIPFNPLRSFFKK